MHAQDFEETRGDTIWTKHQESQERTQKGVTPKDCPNYIEE